MSVDPSKSFHLEVDLCLEELDLICHMAHVLLTLLLGDDQCSDKVGLSALRSAQDRACLNLVLCVKLRPPYKLFHYLNGAVNSEQPCRPRLQWTL